MTTLDLPLLKASWRSWYASDMRIVGPGWLQLVWTFLFSCAVGLMFFVLGLALSIMGSGRLPSGSGMLRWFLANLGVALVIGYTIHLLFSLTTRWIGADRIRRFSNAQRGWYFGGVPFVGLLIGWPLGSWMVGAPGWLPFHRPSWVIGALLFSALMCVLFYFHFDAKARQIDAEKRATEAQLRLLQGQMEPHFMFNTLATVLSLIDTDAPQAKRMLECFIDYLRASLGKLRTGDSTLQEELAMVEGYLALMKMRMGERLDYRIEVDEPALRQAALPPLLLQPLVENAIHHGLECKLEGGRVLVRARRAGDRLVIEVDDDGLGQAARPARRSTGNGVALANLRERLSTRWGNQAALTLELRPDAGARAALTVPFEMAAI